MKFSLLTPAEFEHVATAVHEAAHAVMAVLAGAEVTSCVASATDGRVEFHGHDPEKAAGIAWAGPYAEARLVHGNRPGKPSMEALRQALADTSEEDLLLMGGRMAQAVESDVEFAWPAIFRLALHLHDKGSAKTADIHRALGVRPGLDIDMVRWAYRQRIDPATIRQPGMEPAA
ncbi:hypothetical protein [Nocardia nova]|uniref:hypothetical protein n=1 Tax=Nocardia nova TaxID=37330 RepID=UPI00273A1408|nr:hypothetical protein [Nocardia nova]